MSILHLGEEEVSFLYPQSPAQSFKYSTLPDVLTVSIRDILTVVHPTTVTGRTYTLMLEEDLAATSTLITRKNN